MSKIDSDPGDEIKPLTPAQQARADEVAKIVKAEQAKPRKPSKALLAIIGNQRTVPVQREVISRLQNIQEINQTVAIEADRLLMIQSVGRMLHTLMPDLSAEKIGALIKLKKNEITE